MLGGSGYAATSVPVPAYPFATNVTLKVSAVKSGALPYSLPPISLNIITSLPDTNVVTISGTNQLTLMEGQSSNLVLYFSAPGSSLVLVDYAPTNLPPAFVSMSSLQIANAFPGGGTGSVQINFDPLHDAAGPRPYHGPRRGEEWKGGNLRYLRYGAAERGAAGEPLERPGGRQLERCHEMDRRSARPGSRWL